MSHAPLPGYSESGPTWPQPPGSPASENLGPTGESKASPLLAVLHDALAAGVESPDAILRSIADTARFLTGADATAIALRTNDGVVCRARSGDIAPELGAALNVNSGISGECFRTSRVLRCDDTEADGRVDPEVCRLLGMRSIAVVPLGSSAATFGILEVFSGQAHAFADEQISFLKSLGEIAEIAYLRESGAETLAPARAGAALGRSANLTPPDTRKQWPRPAILNEAVPRTKHRYWILGGVAALTLLATAVAWWSWHEPAEMSASSQPAATRTQITPDETTERTAPTALSLGPRSEPHDKSRTKAVVRNAARVEAVGDANPPRPPSATTQDIHIAQSSETSIRRSTDSISANESPPTVVLGASENRDQLANIAAPPARLPALEVRVSQGVTASNLLHKVTPTYPREALWLGLEGSVTLSVSIAEDGTVRDVKLLRGQPDLAASAVAAVRQWRYSPTLVNGKPTSVQREITVAFRLR